MPVRPAQGQTGWKEKKKLWQADRKRLHDHGQGPSISSDHDIGCSNKSRSKSKDAIHPRISWEESDRAQAVLLRWQAWVGAPLFRALSNFSHAIIGTTWPSRGEEQGLTRRAPAGFIHVCKYEKSWARVTVIAHWAANLTLQTHIEILIYFFTRTPYYICIH